MSAIVNDAKGFDFLASVAGMIRTDWRYVGDDLTYVMAMLIFMRCSEARKSFAILLMNENVRLQFSIAEMSDA